MANPYNFIGVIGDVHCEHESLAVVIDTLMALGVETIVCTGDLPTGRGDINRCCDLLQASQIRTVRGNHDRWQIDLPLITLPYATHPSLVSKKSWRFLESLPVTMELPTPSGLALLCHGLGPQDMQSVLPEQSDREVEENPFLQDLEDLDRYRWIINGHSHHRMVRQCRSLTIINAGTLRRDHNPCFAAIDFARGVVTFWDVLNLTAVELSAELVI